GGAVAQSRVEGLLAERAKVTVVSPAITDVLAQLVNAGVIRHIARVYLTGDLAGFELAFVATDDLDVNQTIFSEARLRGVWINSADDPENCDFILPAVVRRGNLSVAVCTGGASPATTRAIREELDTYFTPDYALLVRIAGEVRQELKDRSIKVNPEAWNQALRGEFRRLVAENSDEQAKALLLETLRADV
ncbi:MAG TPA: bifunctional precorrin-2 dehydrogenase/sirohydrochlorin ferrochelatase, partial [Candidatus Binatia bacterium]|nr:bifunctional precorrin-2 dehydrogenase/sirohydrochlorin ferrochelatase [Candidatus Binatia bacterium]